MKQQAWLGLGVWALSSAWLISGEASAQSLRACGDIDVRAEGSCELVPPSLDCEAECSLDSLELACDAQLRAECHGECDLDPELSCTGSCEASCEARCSDLDPGAFDCQADCQADCSGTCSARCDDDECLASCEGQCEASCEAECDVELPSADCSGQCEASCQGSCEASANLDCRVDCEVERRADCEVELEGRCRADCDTERGALFCDGQYVDHGGNLAECRAALRDALDIEVTTRGEADGSCGGGRCEGKASGSATASCSTIGGASQSSHAALLALGGLFALALVRRFG